MRIRRESLKVSRALFRLCFRDGKLDASRVHEVAMKTRESHLRNKLEVLSAFKKFVAVEISEHTLTVESAVSQGDSGNSVFKAVEAKYGPALQKVFKVTPALIGGLRIQLGSQVWDGSLKNRLQSLETSLS